VTENRKPRNDAWYASLTEEQQAQVRDRFRRFQWFEVGAWAAETFGIKAPGRTGLYGFREWFDEHEEEFLLRQRLRDNAALTREFEAVGAAEPEKLSAALANDVAAARTRGDEDAVRRAVRNWQIAAEHVVRLRQAERQDKDLDLRKQDIELKLRRLELLESKLREAQSTGTAVDPKQLADEIDRILGRKTA
jgi:hypothetical protein